MCPAGGSVNWEATLEINQTSKPTSKICTSLVTQRFCFSVCIFYITQETDTRMLVKALFVIATIRKHLMIINE